MRILFVGIDLAKNVFALHGVDEAGKPALVNPNMARGKLLDLVASAPSGWKRAPVGSGANRTSG